MSDWACPVVLIVIVVMFEAVQGKYLKSVITTEHVIQCMMLFTEC